MTTAYHRHTPFHTRKAVLDHGPRSDRPRSMNVTDRCTLLAVTWPMTSTVDPREVMITNLVHAKNRRRRSVGSITWKQTDMTDSTTRSRTTPNRGGGRSQKLRRHGGTGRFEGGGLRGPCPPPRCQRWHLNNPSTAKSRQLPGDFVTETPYRGSAPGPRWGTPWIGPLQVHFLDPPLHGGYRPLGLVWPCGSQQRWRRPAPCWERVREGVAPPATRVRGCHPRENFENANAKHCILMHFQLCPRDVRPWMESMRSLTFEG